MFDQFIKEKWIYVPYERQDKLSLNGDILERLEKKLNSNGIITEINPNPFYNLERNFAKAKSQSVGGNYDLPLAKALIYSNNSPLSLDIFRNVCVHAHDPFFGQDVNLNYTWLELRCFSSADKEDLKFIYNCLEKTRFRKTK